MARLTADLYFWRGLEITRPWREWKLTANLHSQGLPVPQPIAARVSRAGLFYRGDLITRRIEPAQTLADLLSAKQLPPDGWQRLGTMLRRFHNAGVRHDDINARNILVDGSGAFHLIDFDKAAIVGSGAWREQNLARFRRSLEKFVRLSPRFHYTETDWAAFLNGYGQ
jgi:3-deoxy-D-manno-octulosonic acid kinase